MSDILLRLQDDPLSDKLVCDAYNAIVELRQERDELVRANRELADSRDREMAVRRDAWAVKCKAEQERDEARELCRFYFDIVANESPAPNSFRTFEYKRLGPSHSWLKEGEG